MRYKIGDILFALYFKLFEKWRDRMILRWAHRTERFYDALASNIVEDLYDFIESYFGVMHMMKQKLKEMEKEANDEK